MCIWAVGTLKLSQAQTRSHLLKFSEAEYEVGIFPRRSQALSYIVHIMAADELATQDLKGINAVEWNKLVNQRLTHLDFEKMAAIWLTDFSNSFFLNENWCILIRISPKFIPKGSIKNKPAMVLGMVWHRTGNKPLSEPMLV